MCAVGTRSHAVVDWCFAHIFDNFHAVHRVSWVVLCLTYAVSRGSYSTPAAARVAAARVAAAMATEVRAAAAMEAARAAAAAVAAAMAAAAAEGGCGGGCADGYHR